MLLTKVASSLEGLNDKCNELVYLTSWFVIKGLSAMSLFADGWEIDNPQCG